jgi:alpha-1,2-mannosyltransferase
MAIPTTMVWLSLNLGQVNIALWLAIVLDLVLVRRGNRFGGLLIGVAAAVKLVPAIFVLFLFAAGERRAALRGVVGFALATAVAWVIAPTDSWTYWTRLMFDSSRVGLLDDARNNSLRGLLAHLSPGSAATVLWLAGAAVVIVVGLRRSARSWNERRDLHAILVVGCVGALVSPITWTHHLVFLPLGLLSFVGPAPGGARGRSREGRIGRYSGPLGDDLGTGRAPAWARSALLFVVWLALVDPVGLGVSPWTSGARALAMIVVVFGPAQALAGRMRALRTADDAAITLSASGDGEPEPLASVATHGRSAPLHATPRDRETSGCSPA